MKEEFDREIDLLLRRRARGTAEPRSWSDGAHLDADELGAFAEGALPAAARLAAAAHLADCTRCRGIVVSLAPTVSEREVKQQMVAAAAAPAQAARTSAWRTFFASLFAPRVLRLAVPVLALSLVGVVSYVALRSKNEGASKAARESRPDTGVLKQEEPSAPLPTDAGTANADATQKADTSTSTTTTTSGPQSRPVGRGAAEERATESDAPSATIAAVAPPPAPPAVPAESAPDMSKSAPREDGEAAKADSREKRGESRDRSQRAAEPVDEVAANDLGTQQRRAANTRANEVQMPDGGARNQQRRSVENNVSGGYTAGGGGSATAPPKESEREASRTRTEALRRERAARKAGEDDADRSVETRSAAGHRFRREGSVWVDVNYRSSMRSTGVRRGTESYRALVADVPEVGRVAEALGGEVIVVVGGRAYHIR